jgi:hypothetical protein
MVLIGQKSPRALEPVRRLPELDRWAGMWVAVKRGEIIAAAETSSQLTHRLREMGLSAKGAVTEFVRPGHEDSYAVGIG